MVVCAEIQRQGDRNALLEKDFRSRILCEQGSFFCYALSHREDDGASSRGRGHQWTSELETWRELGGLEKKRYEFFLGRMTVSFIV